MIKVRLYGTPEEVKRFADYLETSPRIHINQRSEPYSDRGKSVYQRIYLEIELSESAAEIIKRLKGKK